MSRYEDTYDPLNKELFNNNGKTRDKTIHRVTWSQLTMTLVIPVIRNLNPCTTDRIW